MTINQLNGRISKWMDAMDVPAAGRIDAVNAGICWDDHDLFAVVDMTEVEAAKLSRTRSGAAGRALKTWETAEYTHGSCWEEWMERPRFTPEALFAERCHSGSMPDGAEFLHLLRQFALIKECDWARSMLAALHDPDPIEFDLSDYDPDRPELWVADGASCETSLQRA